MIVYGGQMQRRATVLAALLDVDDFPMSSHDFQRIHAIHFGGKMNGGEFLLVQHARFHTTEKAHVWQIYAHTFGMPFSALAHLQCQETFQRLEGIVLNGLVQRRIASQVLYVQICARTKWNRNPSLVDTNWITHKKPTRLLTAMLLFDVLQNIDTIASGGLMGGRASLAILHGQTRVVALVQPHKFL